MPMLESLWAFRVRGRACRFRNITVKARGGHQTRPRLFSLVIAGVWDGVDVLFKYGSAGCVSDQKLFGVLHVAENVSSCGG
mmetsp:Transcript_48641/g.78329  ORF Transcript_48641/g.78329 Transcript_48641/m.78329 type:complete len:81 (-) Transcript_48641:1953-2195(-)